jgi:hypothetical protein
MLQRGSCNFLADLRKFEFFTDFEVISWKKLEFIQHNLKIDENLIFIANLTSNCKRF